MQFERYNDISSFAAAVWELLLEHEMQNNLPLSFITRGEEAGDDWLFATVKADDGAVLLTAACTPPYNIALYETRNRPNAEALALLSRELKALGYRIPGVIAEASLARRFAEIHAGRDFNCHLSLLAMRLEKLSCRPKTAGALRLAEENDLFFLPYWQNAFATECRVETRSLGKNAFMAQKFIQKGRYFVWQDRLPVAQVQHVRSTPNGAILGGVYTPPYFRGHGYASGAVAELSRQLLAQDYKFAGLFADSQNPTSCGIYHNLGYRNLCSICDYKFAQPV